MDSSPSPQQVPPVIASAPPVNPLVRKIVNRNASRMLLKAFYLPFVAVAGLTVVCYDISRSGAHPNREFIVCAVVLNLPLLVFWWFIFRSALAALEQLSFSKAAANAGTLLAYAVGLFVGWIVHKC